MAIGRAEGESRMSDLASLSPSDAAWAGDLSGVDAAIRAGADVNAADGQCQPALHLAIEPMEVEIARRLIAAGAEVNRDLGQGWTPLAHAVDLESDAACQVGLSPDEVSTALTELLLAAGAIPTDRAIELARGHGNHRALALLNRAGLA
jgi:ankyrin repeat protein